MYICMYVCMYICMYVYMGALGAYLIGVIIFEGTYITVKQKFSEVFNKDHLYTMSDKHNLHKQAKKGTRILEKYLVKAIHKQTHKYKNTSKSASFSGESLAKFGL